MGKLVTPEVYHVGYTVMDGPEMGRYLADSGNEDFLESIAAAREGGLSDGEILCSFYAKLCYASLTLGKNRNVTRVRDIPDNLRGCFDQGHGSVFEHVQLNFVVRDCSRVFTHELVRHRVGTAFCLAGDVQVWSGSQINGAWGGIKKKWTMRELYEKTKTSHGRSRLQLLTVRCFDGVEFVQAKVKSVCASGVKPIFRVTLSDGKTIRCSSDHRFLSRRSPDDARGGWRAVSNIRAGVDQVATNGRRIDRPSREWLEEKYLTDDLGRQDIASLLGVSEPLIGRWLRAYGIKKPGGGRFYAGSSPWNKGVTGVVSFAHSDEVKARIAASKTGDRNPSWAGGLSVKEENARQLRGATCSECGAVDDLHGHHKDRNHWNDSPENVETLCNSCHQKRHIREDGNPNALVVRWRDVIAIQPDGEEMTYDLEVDHPAHNFVANGFVTHNSQTSGRYVRGDSVDVVFDPILEPVRAEVEELQALIEERYRLMVAKMGLDGMSDFTRKKKITSALRRVLPNGQANEIGFSVNLRALRHVVQVRTSRHAEWEIRAVFARVYELTKTRYPLLFHGATEEFVDGIVEVSGMRMQPYGN